MAILTVNATSNFSAQILSNITTLRFTNTSGTANATFNASQFNGVQIAANVQIEGSAGVNGMIVNNASAFDASAWTFASWNANDTITITGTNAPDTITGSSQKDTINGGGANDTIRGGLGADVLNGGAGNDTFGYGALAEIVAGEQINGGTGTTDSGTADRINVFGPTGIYDFTGATINGVEMLDFTSTTAGFPHVKLSEAQTASGKIDEIVGGQNRDMLEVVMSGASINLNHLTFSNWFQTNDFRSPGDTVRITGGTAAVDSIAGTSVDDLVESSGGADSVITGLGNDRFRVSAAHADAAFFFAGSNLNQTDTGTDALELTTAGFYDLRQATFLGVEQMIFSENAMNLTRDIVLNGSQVGVGKINSFLDLGNSSTNINRLTIEGSNTDLSTATQSGIDLITINGTSGNDTLTTIVNVETTINGGDGDDTITGGSFSAFRGGTTRVADNLFGGGGNDTFVYNSAGSQIDAGEVIDGGFGTNDRILFATNNSVGTSGDFSAAAITGIERFEFAGTNANDQFATFTASQLTAIGNIVGNQGRDILEVNSSGTVNLSSLTFTNFTGGDRTGFGYGTEDHIRFTGGTVGVDNFTGTSQDDQMFTSGGADTFSTGAGNDILDIAQMAHLATLNADLGTGNKDALRIRDSGVFTLGNNIVNFESIEFGNGATTFTVDGSRMGAGKIDHLTSAGDVDLVVNGDTDLSALTLDSWSNDENSITINGNTANNTLIGSVAFDTINGGDGNDTIEGNFGRDILNGGSGNDRFIVTTEFDARQLEIDGSVIADTFNGDIGTDDRIVMNGSGNGVIDNVDLRDSVITGIEGLEFAGTATEQQLVAVKASQTGLGKINSVFGNVGADELRIDADSGVVNLAGLSLTNWTESVDRLRVVANPANGIPISVTGSNFGDIFELVTAGSHNVNGGGGNDIISTGIGTDTINGGTGNDIIDSGGAQDFLTGGAGSDTFILTPNASDRDTITDFATGSDKLSLSALLFGGGLVAGSLSSGQFVVNTTGLAGDADDRFIFNSVTNTLLFDSNGSAAGGSRTVAQFSVNPNLVASDFIITA